MARGPLYTPEEDNILMSYRLTDDIAVALEAKGFRRTRGSIIARKKELRDREDAGALVNERDGITKELSQLDRRREFLLNRLNEIKVALVRDALGGIDLDQVPKEVLEALRASVGSDGQSDGRKK